MGRVSAPSGILRPRQSSRRQARSSLTATNRLKIRRMHDTLSPSHPQNMNVIKDRDTTKSTPSLLASRTSGVAPNNILTAGVWCLFEFRLRHGDMTTRPHAVPASTVSVCRGPKCPQHKTRKKPASLRVRKTANLPRTHHICWYP